MYSLKDWRAVSDLVSHSKLLNGQIDCPQLLLQTNLNAPKKQVRSFSLVKPKLYSTSFNTDPVIRVCKLARDGQKIIWK